MTFTVRIERTHVATERRRGTRKAVELPPGYSPIRANKIIPSVANYRSQFRPISPSAEIADAYEKAVGNIAASDVTETAPTRDRTSVAVLSPPPPSLGHPQESIDLEDDSDPSGPVAVSLLPVDDETVSDAAEPDSTAAAEEGRTRRWSLPGSARKKSGSSTNDSPKVYDANGVEIGDFDINKIESAPTDGRYRRGRRMLAIVVTAIVAFSSITMLMGIMLGRSGIPAQGAVSPAEAAAFRLSKFPVDAAQAFGQQYLSICLSHGNADDVARRQAILADMTTGGVAQGCGWSNGGLQQHPELIVYNGSIQMVDDAFADGDAAYLGFNVSLGSGLFQSVTVPIWVKNIGVGNDMRVVGDLGVTSGPRIGAPPVVTDRRAQDPTLATELQNSVLAPFMTAWGGSDARQLNLVLADGASDNARTGMHGALKNPKINGVQVRSQRADESSSNTSITYQDGDVVSATVSVTWEVVASQSTQMTGYRVELVRNTGKWLVREVSGGSLDMRGGGNGTGMGDSKELTPGSAPTTTPSVAAPTTVPQTTTTAPQSSEEPPPPDN
jgi:hypothetical protein